MADKKSTFKFESKEREDRFTATAAGARIVRPGKGEIDLSSLPPPREEPKK